MVKAQELVSATITRARQARSRRITLRMIWREIKTIHRKVNKLMAIDTQVVARLLAGAGALVEQNRLLVGERDALKETLGSERAAEALEDQQEAAASADILAAADAVERLVQGPETPNVPVPPIEEVPPVVDGEVPVIDEGGSPIEPDSSGGTIPTT